MPSAYDGRTDGSQLRVRLTEGVSTVHVELIGAKESIDKAEDREKFDQAMKNIGFETPRSSIAHSLERSLQVQAGLDPLLLGPLLRWW